MKKALLIILMSVLSIYMYAQNKTDLYGKWQIHYNSSINAKELVLNKASVDLNAVTFGHWGRFIEFYTDGTYEESASAQCGLDDNRYRYTGKWNYNPSTKTIELTAIKVQHGRPNIYATYKVFSSGTMVVKSLTEGRLCVTITKAWEKASPKQ